MGGLASWSLIKCGTSSPVQNRATEANRGPNLPLKNVFSSFLKEYE